MLVSSDTCTLYLQDIAMKKVILLSAVVCEGAEYDWWVGRFRKTAKLVIRTY